MDNKLKVSWLKGMNFEWTIEYEFSKCSYVTLCCWILDKIASTSFSMLVSDTLPVKGYAQSLISLKKRVGYFTSFANKEASLTI